MFLHKWIYKVRNFLHRLREVTQGVGNAFGRISCKSELRAVHHRNGKPYRDLGVISRRVVTNAGVQYMALEFFNASTAISNFKYHASGTGAVAENVTDTALGAEVASRTAGTNTTPTRHKRGPTGRDSTPAGSGNATPPLAPNGHRLC